MEEAGAKAIKKWEENRVLSELKLKLKASGDLVALMQEAKQAPGVKRKREDELIAEIEELAGMAKKLKEERTEAS